MINSVTVREKNLIAEISDGDSGIVTNAYNSCISGQLINGQPMAPITVILNPRSEGYYVVTIRKNEIKLHELVAFEEAIK